MRVSTCFMFSAFNQPCCPNMMRIGDGNSNSAALSTLDLEIVKNNHLCEAMLGRGVCADDSC